ncbi:MAG TPA: serine/threonine-protein kinase, partial [Polyangiales bacterium]|nr:serine/threonine-protein kinase [Polyangiales bacterium]
TLHAHFAQTPELVERFHREANAATLVGNEHIIEVTDFGFFDDSSPFIVMEYLEGVELGALLEREGSLPIARVVHIITQICDALSSAHARGIVHRDMKPENVFLIRRGQDPDFVKVLDFGISKMRTHGDELKAGLTRTGMALGTPYYMPPEQAQGVRDIDQRADVYAVGVIMYRALGGRLPFDAETYPALILKIMTETPPELRQLRGDVPEALDRHVRKAMARDRQDRFQGVEDLSLALQPFAALNLTPHMLASLRPTPQSGTGTPYTSDLPSRPPTAKSLPSHAGTAKLALIGGVGLSLVAVAVVLWSVLGRDPRSEEHVVAPAHTGPAEPANTNPNGNANGNAHTNPLTAVPPGPSAAAVAAAAAPTAETPRPNEVRLQINAEPSDARIFIAGAEFPNPTDASRPRSLDPVRIRVESPGYQALEQLAIFDQDRNLHFKLQRGHGTKELSALDRSERRSKNDPPTGVEMPAAAAPPHAAPAAEPPAAPNKQPDGLYQGPTGKIRDEF